jgi:hypothetical protein
MFGYHIVTKQGVRTFGRFSRDSDAIDCAP